MSNITLLIAMPTQGDIATPTVKSLIGLTQASAAHTPHWQIEIEF